MQAHHRALWLAVVAVAATLAAAGTLKEHNTEVNPRTPDPAPKVEEGKDISVGNDFLDEVQQLQRVLLEKPHDVLGSSANQEKSSRGVSSTGILTPTPLDDAVKSSKMISKRTPQPLPARTPDLPAKRTLQPLPLRTPQSLAISNVRGDEANKPAYTIVEPEFQKRQGRPGDSFTFPQKVSLQDRRPSIPIDRFGVSGIASPLFQLQQQLLNGGAKLRPAHSPHSPAPSASEEYFWDTEGDADYLNDRTAPNNGSSATSPTAAGAPLQTPPTRREEGDLSGGVDTFNIVITKNSTGLPPNQKLKLLPGSQVVAHHLGPRVTSPAELEQVVQSAVRAAVNSSTSPLALEEAVAQVVETPGHAATVNVINSSIADLSEIESALNALLGTDVVYRKLENDRGHPQGLALGYIPESNNSAVEKILNGTLGLSGFHASGSKTNVVNIFIINVIGHKEDLLKVDDWADSKRKLNLEQLTLDKTNNMEEDILEELITAPVQPKSKPLASKTPTPQPEQVQEERPYGSWPGEVGNSQGINLNQNTVLNLLPDFIRATTIPPVVPIFNTSLHEALGTKPSVLGLLPNEVFDIEKTTVDLYDNSTGGGVIRKPINVSNPLDGHTDVLSIGYPNGLYQHPVFSSPDVEQPRPVSSNPYGFRSNFGSFYDFNPNRVLDVSPSNNEPQTDRASIVPVPQLVTGVVPAAGSARRPSLGHDQEDFLPPYTSQEPDISDSYFDNSAQSGENLINSDLIPSETNQDEIESELTSAKQPDSTSHELNLWHLVNYTTEDVTPAVEDVPQFVDLHKSVIRKQQPVAVKRKTKLKDDKSEDEGLMSMDGMMKAFAIGALPSGVAVASALWPMWAPLVFGKRRRKRNVKNVEPAWYSLLNGSRYHAKLMNLKKGKMENGTEENANSAFIGTSELAALIEAANPSVVKVINKSATFENYEVSPNNISVTNNITISGHPTASNGTVTETINSTTRILESSAMPSESTMTSMANITLDVESGAVSDDTQVVKDNVIVVYASLDNASSNIDGTQVAKDKDNVIVVYASLDNASSNIDGTEVAKDYVTLVSLDNASSNIDGTEVVNDNVTSVIIGNVSSNIAEISNNGTSFDENMPSNIVEEDKESTLFDKLDMTSNMIKTTTKRSVDNSSDGMNVGTTRKYVTAYDLMPKKTTLKYFDEISPSIAKLQSMLTETTTRNSVFMTTPNFEDGKSPAQDMMLVSNFLNTALNGWSSGEKNLNVVKTTDSYIHLDISDGSSPADMPGATDSPIVLIDKVTGEIRPLSNISKNVSAHLQKNTADFSSKLESLRNKSFPNELRAGFNGTGNFVPASSLVRAPSSTSATRGTTATTSGTTATTSGPTATTSGTTATKSGTTATTSGTTATTSVTTTTISTTPSTTPETTTTPIIRAATPILRGADPIISVQVITTTVAPTPAPSSGGSPGFFSLLASAFTNPTEEMASAMSLVGTISVYGAAVTMPIWLPLMVGRRKRRSLSDLGAGDEGGVLERVPNAEERIKSNYAKLVKKHLKKYSVVDQDDYK